MDISSIREILPKPLNVYLDSEESESMFDKLFKSHIFHVTTDDLLFFVSDEDELVVRRKTSDKLLTHIPTNISLNWKQTFFLNLIVHLPFSLKMSVAIKKDSNNSSRLFSLSGEQQRHENSSFQAINSIAKSVYASPNKLKADSKSFNEVAYPTIYFSLHDFEEGLTIKDGEYLCIELRCRDCILFEGAASFTSIEQVYVKGTLFKETKYITMRGPGGKGLAQVAVDSLDRSVSSILKSFINPKVESLICKMVFINLRWNSIIDDLFNS